MSPERVPRLVALVGPLEGRTFALADAPLRIGRSSSNEIALADAGVSRTHAVVERDAEGFTLRDLGSRAGTRVNGEVVAERRLEERDLIEVGVSTFAFVVGDDDVAAFLLTDSGPGSSEEWTLPADEALVLRPGEALAATPGLTAARGLDAMLGLARAIGEVTEERELALRIVRAAFDATPAERGGIVLANPDGSLRPVLAMAREPGASRSVRVSRTATRRVMEQRMAVIENLVGDQPSWQAAESIREACVSSLLCVPLPLHGRVIGVLYLDCANPALRFDASHLEVVTALATLAAMPLDGARADAPPDGDHAAAAGEPAPLSLDLDADAPLHLGQALHLSEILRRAPESSPVPTLFSDYTAAPPTTGASVPDAVLDRLALLPEGATWPAAAASRAPSLARFAALVASMPTGEAAPATDARSWFRDVLRASGLVALRARRVACEPRGPAAMAPGDGASGVSMEGLPSRLPGTPPGLALARRIAARLAKAQPGRWLPPEPVMSRHPPFLSLDSDAPMGASPRGAILLSDADDTVARKVRAARTDSTSSLDPEAAMSPAVRNLLLLLHAAGGEPMEDLLNRLAGKGHGALKESLAESVIAFLAPLRARRARLAADGEARERLAHGSRDLDEAGREAAELVSCTPGLLR